MSAQFETSPERLDINITACALEGIQKLLRGLIPHKAAGPDNISHALSPDSLAETLWHNRQYKQLDKELHGGFWKNFFFILKCI